MATSKEELRRAADLEKLGLLHKRTRNKQEEAEYEELITKYGNDILADPSIIKAQKKEEELANYTLPIRKNNPNWDAIIEDYEKTGRKVIRKDETISFVFANKNDAISFFKDQAKQGRAFQVYNEKKDHCIYSDGNKFVQGPLKQIEDYLANNKAYTIKEDGTLEKNEPDQQESIGKSL
ncbi:MULTISPECIES: hypothetical protein [Legionella]|uniref:Substrate of the Dot/Icm secretion system n=1 Tax=Legionella drozanskii LLAP-1 TaxID=1212489 RepID=A0A0W0SRL9_9GAMM|nr:MULTISPECIES: hypothetical protein [Legionella]KTC85939.1 hypothetical protein Ldro_2264 [Legionella drozanskii LLAP-1]PJE09657.1 MAG: hypothetical protein CK430_10845 [Legionella sp.]